MTPVPFQEMFTINKKGDFVIPRINTVKRGEETVRYRGPKIWEIVPNDLQNTSLASLAIFKDQIKNGNLLVVHGGYVKFLSRA